MFIVPSTLATAVRYPLGLKISALGARPTQQLELYDFEACPFCRKAREALTMLDLDVLVKPSPRGGTHWRAEAIARGGKAQFPLLVDGDTLIYESDAIVAHLYERYGAGTAPLWTRLGPINTMSSALASAMRAGNGRAVQPHRDAAQPLELWSFESSPYCRRVREVLCELELAYVLHNVGKGSPKRTEFRERAGKVQVPYLEDPNTGAHMFESRDIVRYLRTTYGSP